MNNPNNSISPKSIYLQVDGDGPPYTEVLVTEREGVCWCQDKVFPGDVKYIRSDLVAELRKKIRMLESQVGNYKAACGEYP